MRHEFIIVGAGSAGATLAARLADAGRDVLLLESGPDYRSADAPAAMLLPNPNPIIVEPEYARYRYDELKARRTSEQQPYTYWRGAGSGGSSAINGQIAIRGTAGDYDLWAAAGCEGWSFSDVLPYFNRLETDLEYGDEPFHGNSGPIPIYRAPFAAWGPVDLALAEAALKASYPFHHDHNRPGVLGISTYAINSRNQKRVSTNDGYLEPRRALNNLTIRGDVTIDRVLFEGTRAVGVCCLAGDEIVEYHADTVVLSAGAVHSPGILIRSGIGPAEQLSLQGLTCLVDLPVGLGFQDHPVINVMLPIRDEHAVPAGFRHTNCCLRYSSELHGASPGDMMIVAMNRLGDSIGHAVGRSFGVDTLGLMGVWVNQCESRGQVSIESTDPRVQPIVEANMLATESDRRRLYDGWLRLREMLTTKAVQQITGGCWLDKSGTRPEDLDSYADFLEFALRRAADTQHASCTCRMGNPNDRNTVVDPDCRVLGTEGLLVVDASIMPSVPSANTNLTAIMIGEKMADQLITQIPGG